MRFRVLCLIVLPVLAGCNRQAPVQAKKDNGPMRVQVAPVVVREMQRQVQAVGSLFPYEEVTISSEIDGRVVEVNADLGDTITAGTVLVRVSDEEQKYLVQQTEASLRQSLERLGLKNEDDRVKDVKETPDVRRAQADLYDAEQRFKRVSMLVEQQIGSRQDLDAAQARYDAMKAAYESSINQTRNLMQDTERSRAVLGLQRKKLRDTDIKAPFPGQVKDRLVNAGQYVRANTPVFNLVKIDPIRMKIEVPERMAPWIKTNQMANVTLEAFPDRTFRGKIWRISPTVDQTKRTFIVEALISNPSGELKPGSYASATIFTDKVDRLRLVPARAINYVYGANKAYVVKEGSVEARDVKLGDRIGEDVEITEGVDEGEQVATSQLARLDTGVKVQIGGGGGGGKRGGGSKGQAE